MLVLEPFARKSWPNWGFLKAVTAFAPNVVHYHLTDAAKWAPRIQKRCVPGHVFHLHVNKRSAAYATGLKLGHLIAVSESTAEFYRDELKIPADRLHIVFNGVDAHHSDTAKHAKTELKRRSARSSVCHPMRGCFIFPGESTRSKSSST